MDFSDLLRDLALSPAVAEQLESKRALFPEHRVLIEGMTAAERAKDSYEALAALLGEDDMGMLACQLCAAVTTREKYRSLGVDDHVFLATFGCYSRFLKETLHRTGKLCFDRGWWSYRQLSLRLFRIGELEYELVEQPHAVSLHIPSDACIAPEAVDASLAQAREFLARFFPDYARTPIGCHSWLLSPALREHLGPDSRIRAFQDRFQLNHVKTDAKDVWEWLFAAPEDTAPQDLREDTSLQRSVKKTLLSGGSIGVAGGILKYQ